MRHYRSAFVLALLLSFSACAPPAPPDEEQVVAEVSAFHVPECAQLEERIEALALREMNARIDYGLRYSDHGSDDGSPVAAAPPSPAPTSGPQAFSTTNTQEKDVDEPDF